MNDWRPRGSIEQRLMCRCEKIVSVDGGDTVEIHLPEHHCTDMTGAIQVARMLRPQVTQIRVFSDHKPDIVYRGQPGRSDWVAYDMRG